MLVIGENEQQAPFLQMKLIVVTMIACNHVLISQGSSGTVVARCTAGQQVDPALGA